jgi:Domain of unknown function (DUF4412)
MKIAALLGLTLSLCAAAHADFSYTTTRKTTGGMMAAMAGAAGPQTSKFYLKGQKMKIDHGGTSTILDFDAQTITTINTTQKTYSVKGFSDVAEGTKHADIDAKIDARETGQKKIVNGYNASELIMTMEVESAQARQLGKMQMEVDMWLSADVPGSQELHDFYQKNAGKFPWAAMGAAGNPGMQQAMADLQRKLASMHGVPVEQIVRMKAPGGAGGASADQMAQMQAGMAKACPQMQAAIAKGGPAAAILQQQYDRMCGGTTAAETGATPGSSSNALIEMTMDSSDFSSGSIPDAVFAIPDGFEKSH